ncbi:hypothetical protein PENNAL_c0010G03812 [Penicillium nalgiovense]|uniref:Uncharacterized protein n=1 Tax=Penicillium nalgiovense TaxID=60175 RepID=A0A1V6YUN0_PENNA|nr:hypothetical protein PENNAL_c0010G03812 [Penicillium nalgiovense]
MPSRKALTDFCAESAENKKQRKYLASLPFELKRTDFEQLHHKKSDRCIGLRDEHSLPQTIDVIIRGLGAGDSVSEEQLVLGDETDLQGRLSEQLSRPVTTCLQALAHLLRVGNFKASSEAARPRYSRVPDLVVLDNCAATKIVGEVKAPWPVSHVRMLSRGVRRF